jgi:hypothetical protein
VCHALPARLRHPSKLRARDESRCGPALATDRVDHVSLSQFWLRLKGHRNKTAGFFVELVEITLSSTKKKDDDDASSAQIH